MNNALSFKEKLVLGTAVISTFIGYGRRTYAGNPGCYPIGNSTYLCAGSATTSQTFPTANNAIVYTTSNFTINTSDTAISFTGDGALTFIDNYGSSVHSTNGNGLEMTSTGPNGGTASSVTIQTGPNGQIYGKNVGVAAYSKNHNTNYATNIAITTGLDSTVSAGNNGILALSYNSSDTPLEGINHSIVITSGTGSSVSGGENGIVAVNYDNLSVSSNNSTTITTGKNSIVSGGTNGIVAGILDLASYLSNNTITISTGIGSTVSGGINGIYALGIDLYSLSSNNTITITTGSDSTVSGGTHGILAHSYNSYDSHNDNINHNILINTGIGSTVSGGTSGISANTHGSVSINNKGTIENTSHAPTDQAISAYGFSSVIITNTGLINGAISLSGKGNNSILNSGTWNTVGEGNQFNVSALENTITNTVSGIINTASNSGAPVTTTFNNLSSFINAGKITMQNGLVGDRTVVNGVFTGENGGVFFDTALGSDNSSTDQLVINGIANGSTKLFVHDIGGNGQLTTELGIKLVEINLALPPGLAPEGLSMLSSPPSSVFSLGNRVAAGAYEYQLFYNGNVNNQNWYLRNTLDSGVPNYRIEVPVDMAAPLIAQQFGFVMLDTLDDRTGSKLIAKDKGPWVRLIGQVGYRDHGDSLASFSRNGPSYDWNIGAIQAGYDIWQNTHDNGSSDMIGADFAAGRASSDVNKLYSGRKAGNITMDGYTFGAYWTHYAQNGWYTDAVFQGTLYDQIHASSILGQTLSTSGQGYLGSLEAGRIFDTTHEVSVTPEAQLIYQYVSINKGSDSYGRISYRTPDALYARIGAKVAKNWASKTPISAWTRLNLWHNFESNTDTTFATLSGENPVTLTSNTAYSWAQISLGASTQLPKGMDVFVSGDFSVNFSGGNGQSWGGRLGVKYAR